MTRFHFSVLACAACLALGAVLLTPGCKPKPAEKPRPVTYAPDRPVVVDPVQRGKLIFAGAEYSSTGLTCSHCHSASPAMEEGRRFIAHSAYGMAARGAWWISTQEQFDAKLGAAATLAEAANVCIAAPYMGGKSPMSAEDAKALEAFITSISDPAAKDSTPFIQTPPPFPAKGLTPNKGNGKLVYEQTCAHCHGAVAGLVNLKDEQAELNVAQFMAKVRKQPDWEDGFKDTAYAMRKWPFMRLAGLLGLRSALAQEPGAGSAAPETPAPEGAPSAEAAAEAGHAAGARLFPENAMPYFAADILSDQEVVDVAFYVKEDL